MHDDICRMVHVPQEATFFSASAADMLFCDITIVVKQCAKVGSYFAVSASWFDSDLPLPRMTLLCQQIGTTAQIVQQPRARRLYLPECC